MPYVTIRCPNPPDGIAAPYLRDSKGVSIVTKDNPVQIRQKLRDEIYRAFAAGFLSAFAFDRESLEETALRIVQQLREVK